MTKRLVLLLGILVINPIVYAMQDQNSIIKQQIRQFITGSTSSSNDKQKQHIFTGGPSAGKTTLVTNLAQLKTLGSVIKTREAATDHIKKRQAAGVCEPWLENNFQTAITELINDYEDKASFSDASLVLLDRSTIDSLSYQLLWRGTEMDDIIHTSVQEKINNNHYEKKVFFIEGLTFIEDNGVRCENEDDATKVANALKTCYEELGFTLITIPNIQKHESIEDRIRERMKLILVHLLQDSPELLEAALAEVTTMPITLTIA